MGSRDRKLLIGLAVLLVVLALAADAFRDDDAGDPRPSSFLTSPGGTAALYLTLEELGFEARRRVTPLVGAEPLMGPLVLLAPTESPTPAELGALVAWVRAGGTVIWAARLDDTTADSLGVRLVTVAGDSIGATPAGGWPRHTGHPVEHPLTAGMAAVGGFRFALAPREGVAVEPLLRTSGGRTVAMVIPMGRGRVIALADVEPLRNRTVAASRAAPLLVRAVASVDGKSVVFDEYHHGFRAGGSAVLATLRFLAGDRRGYLLLQLGLAALGLLLLGGARFGSPRPDARARRRDPLEHVDALAEAYRRSRARPAARRLLMAGLLRRLGSAGQPHPGDEMGTVRRGTPAGAAAQLATLEKEWSHGSRGDLVALARAMDATLREATRHR
jgi:hypothetical protein